MDASAPLTVRSIHPGAMRVHTPALPALRRGACDGGVPPSLCSRPGERGGQPGAGRALKGIFVPPALSAGPGAQMASVNVCRVNP